MPLITNNSENDTTIIKPVPVSLRENMVIVARQQYSLTQFTGVIPGLLCVGG